MDRFCLRCKLHKIDTLYAPYVYHSVHKDTTELVQGWVCSEGMWCWHVWCETDGKIMDPIQHIYGIDITYSKTEPQETWDKDDSVVDMYDKYINDKTFWKQQPMKIQDFRTLCLKKRNL